MTQEQFTVDYSSIADYCIGEGSIIITYTTGSGYLFNSIKPGLPIVNKMIELAQAGAKDGLSKYIQDHAAQNYYLKLE
jgi:hypothetical protein